MNTELEHKIKTLPESPGCYLMKDDSGVIYVGKAKNLKNRVRSYFQTNANHTPKVRAMVAHIVDFDIILCDSNLESLILENTLIKKHKPFYNILLRDDKQYPFIRVDPREEFPRLTLVRRTAKDGAKYFGPYLGAQTVRDALDLLRQIFPLRTCSMTLPTPKPKRPCIEYDMGNCLAPCAHLCDKERYASVLSEAIKFLSGNSKPIEDELTRKMLDASAAMQYEKAAQIRDRLKTIVGMMEKQRAVKPGGGDCDVIALKCDGQSSLLAIVNVRRGQIVGADTMSLGGVSDEEVPEILRMFIAQYYNEETLIPNEILFETLPNETDELTEMLRGIAQRKVELIRPIRGDKRALVSIAMKNASDAFEKANTCAKAQYTRTVGATRELAEAIGLQGELRRLECYDISNTQGVLSVASMVVFINGEPAKKEYRHFRIKTVIGANDFASMEETLSRRFTHGLSELKEREAAGLSPIGGKFSDLPDLVIIDGGPEQLAFARRAMLGSGANVPICSLAKRLEEIFLPDCETSILLDRHSPALHLIQRIRDEAHRFAITHHRHLRGKQMTKSELEYIPGIGAARRRALLTKYGGMKALREATLEDIAATPGMTKSAAEVLYNVLHSKDG